MSLDDATTPDRQHRHPASGDVLPTPSGALPPGYATGYGGPVVAGPPDDAAEMAQREILAALFGAPTPGGI